MTGVLRQRKENARKNKGTFLAVEVWEIMDIEHVFGGRCELTPDEQREVMAATETPMLLGQEELSL